MGARRPWLPLAGTSAGLLVWGNLGVPALPRNAFLRTAVNAGAALALLTTACTNGITLHELGLDRRTRRAGSRWGAAAFAAATAGYGVALGIPAGRAALARARGTGLPAGELAARSLLLIPLGTVAVEEVAFRGVLLALARRRLPDRGAGALTSAVFGLWHVRGAVRADASVAGTVLVTSLGGLVFTWLRLRSGSLLAPAGLHAGTNGVGLLAAAAAR